MVGEAYRKAGKSALSILDMSEKIVKEAHDMVALIDDMEWPQFSKHYAKMTDILDQEYDRKVRELVASVVNANCKFT